MRIGEKGRPLVTSLLFLLLLLSSPGEGCGPGRGSGRRRKTRKLTPLVFKQHVPNVSENTLGASGLTDGRIKRGDAKFKDLVRNNNPDILFKDEEGTGADRIMSQRCKDKLNTLAISVLNQWPGVKLRVTEAWDEDGMHAENSLHYEGRAVDITTSDRDRSKYGMLARLAVEAGFDWVYYETRGHIHCSVKSDSSVAINFGGCFPGISQVISQSGNTMTLSELKVGDRVLSMGPDGHLEFSDVIAFLDVNEDQIANYYTLTTEAGHSVTLTGQHFIHIMSPRLANDTSNVSPALPSFTSELPHLSFAQDVTVGQYVLFAKEVMPSTSDNIPQKLTISASTDSQSLPSLSFTSFQKDNLSWRKLTPEKIVSIEVHPLKGMFAPLTSTGTIIVDGFVTSCYAFLKDEQLAHAVFAPLRGYHVMKTLLSDWFGLVIMHFDWMFNFPFVYSTPVNETNVQSHQDGAHWYARFLYNVAVNIIGMDIYISL